MKAPYSTARSTGGVTQAKRPGSARPDAAPATSTRTATASAAAPVVSAESGHASATTSGSAPSSVSGTSPSRSAAPTVRPSQAASGPSSR